MKIVLVPNPNVIISSGQNVGDPYIPLGLLSIGTVLKNDNINVRLVDINRDSLCLDTQESVKEILHDKPDIIGFSTRVNEYYRSLQIAEECKRKRPQSLIIFGGPQASACDIPTLNAFPFIDLIVRGESENNISNVVRSLYNHLNLHDIPGMTFRDNGKLIRTQQISPVANLSALPLPDYSLFPNIEKFDKVPIEVGRGCPFNCIYCSTKDHFQRKYRFRDTEQLMKIMTHINNSYGINRFSFQHDNVTVSKKKMRELCNGMKQLAWSVIWTCSARVDCLDQELIEIMAEAGCIEIFIGIETGSPRMQNHIGKKLDVDKVIPTVEILQRNGIEFTASFMMGFPEETLEDLAMTIRLMTTLRFKGNCSEKAQLHIVSAFPGTKIFNQYKNDLRYDGYFSDASVSFITKDMRMLVDKYPEIFASFHYIANEYLDRKFSLKVNFLIQTLLNYFPYTTLILSKIDDHNYPQRILEYISNMDLPEKPWVLATDEMRITTGYNFLSNYIITLENNSKLLEEVLMYEKTAIDLQCNLTANESMIMREFTRPIDRWISKVTDGNIPPLSDLMRANENHVLFIRENNKVKTMILPSKIAEYMKTVE